MQTEGVAAKAPVKHCRHTYCPTGTNATGLFLQEENGRLPHSYNKDDAASLVQLANRINEQASNKVDLDEVCGSYDLIHSRSPCHISSSGQHLVLEQMPGKLDAANGSDRHAVFEFYGCDAPGAPLRVDKQDCIYRTSAMCTYCSIRLGATVSHFEAPACPASCQVNLFWFCA